MAQLVQVVQELSLVRDLPELMAVVRRAARELTGADGATFVLRDGDRCYYADEDAMAPLWKGQRFPMATCISGWAMLNRQPAVVEDIYSDARIPADVYRPTFVKSLVMVPIRAAEPIGAIGTYWAERRKATPGEVELLQALANTAAVAMENVQLYAGLERRVRERTAQLEITNKELEAYTYAVSHDLGAPLRAIRGFGELLAEEWPEALCPESRAHLVRIQAAAAQMTQLLNELLKLSRVSAAGLTRLKVNLTAMAREILDRFCSETPEREVRVSIAPDLQAQADPGLVRVALENLLSNAWKYSSNAPETRIEVGSQNQPDGSLAIFVRDHGAGFDARSANNLFQPFRRFHAREDFPGSGIGLATVQRIVHRHGGRIWAESEVGQGATFYFTLP